ncbi:E3 ubiquitin-protein ligase TRIM39-like [Hyla sarda]|uniref:E3 ubiquitin-protein ligase TRIM39-like n=1 Tax=Hyla sarda TaxID=327740 RepID=UPI0024C40249|nr:E3 ubiquitin-protein ligase TRIM39-like [Hyla sarda]
MASAGLRDELLCSICLNIYTHPVTLRCGHNFCRDCIGQVLNTQDGAGGYSCPECRAEYRERPSLIKNITLCNVAERLRSTQPHQEEITGIHCTYCVDSPVPAVRYCLHCEASLCDKHVRSHNKSEEHVLTDPTTSQENRKCSVHKKVLEYYCTDDSTCICVYYAEEEHLGHRVEKMDEASEKKKKKLRNVLQKLITKREKTEERVRSLEERWIKAQEEASGEAERVTALFIDIRRRLDDLEKRILGEISRQEEKMSLSDVIQKLEMKKDELSRKTRDIEELCNMADPLTVLQDPDTGDLCDPEEGGGDEDTGGHDTTHDVDVITGMLHAGFSDIGAAAENRGVYGQGPAKIFLDVNTADNNKIISDDLKTATRTYTEQNRPETAERFQGYYYSQVMSSGRFSSGRHYWDVEIRGVGVGMCYPSIERRGARSLIGHNNKSWGLYRGLKYNIQYTVIHDSEEIQLPHQVSSDRFRICLDYKAFYELCDPIRHLHTFTTTFTEPLHAVLYVYNGSIKISGGGAIEEICPETSDITGSRI